MAIGVCNLFFFFPLKTVMFLQSGSGAMCTTDLILATTLSINEAFQLFDFDDLISDIENSDVIEI